METESVVAPRILPYRFYYKWYAFALSLVWLLNLGIIAMLLLQTPASNTSDARAELLLFGALSVLLPILYVWWLHPKLTRQVQVFRDFVRVSHGAKSWDIKFSDVQRVSRPFASFIKLEMTTGKSWWFSAALERIDYLWEGLGRDRPELVISPEEFEKFRLKLVQFDHHEKRKEWFFRHRFLDIVNWVVLPLVVILAGYQYQSQDVVIHSKGLYFFRLTMYSLFVTISCAFLWSVMMKKFVFDRMVEKQMESGKKLRDLRREDQILQRSKFLQTVTSAFVLALIVKSDFNLFSVTKMKQGAQAYNLKSGTTVIVDNRYNCVRCKHALKEGDLILFGRGTIGQVLAAPGEVIAQVQSPSAGRSIASETVTEIPEGHIALKTGAEGKDVVLIPINDLVGKLKSP